MEPANRELPVIPGFAVTGHIGEGGMGAVYAAEDLSLGRRVAIKLVSEKIAGQSESKARFQREARTLATIEHPHVVHVYALGECNAGAYLVMEYVDGETLSAKLERELMLSVPETIAITRQIVLALQAAWGKNVIHRDIKPSNVLIDTTGRVKVADFGLAKPVSLAGGRVEDTLTQSGYIVGSPHYISPEQVQGHAVDFRSDVYAVGLIAFEMLTGSRPFGGTTPVAIIARHLSEPLPPIAQKRRGVPPRLAALIEKMTAKDPSSRPASYDEILRELDAIESGKAADTQETLETMPIEKPKPRVAYAIAAAVLAIALIASIAWLAAPKHPATTPTTSGPMAIAVTPFYGPDPDSQKEGQVMAALIEREIRQRLPADVRVAGINETKDSIHSHDEARALAQRLHADVVIWGETFALRNETEVQPYVTLIPRPKPAAKTETSTLFESRAEEASDRSASVVRLASTAPNQIELHRTSAAGVADVVMTVAGTYALYNENNPKKALDIFRHAPQTADTLRYQAEALFRTRANAPQFPPPYATNFDYWTKIERTKEGENAVTRDVLALLDRAIALDPADAQTFAMRGDLLWEIGEFSRACDDYRTAAAKGTPYNTRHAILFDGKLFTAETYRSHVYTGGHLEQTANLLALDPASFHILMRRRLPGLASTYRVAGRWLEITFAPAGRESKVESATIRFDGANFDRPVFYGSNLLVRMRTMKASWTLAANFLDEFGPDFADAKTARFRPRSKGERDPDAPVAFEELESALRHAIEVDPTNAWHRFHLGQSLWFRGARDEAETVWGAAFANVEPDTPYYEYAWMTQRFVREGLMKWAERTYAIALAKRRASPQPIIASSLIERLINTPFVRAAALGTRSGGLSPSDSYVWLLRARELGGPVFETEDMVARFWADDFERRGDAARAAHEREVARRAGRAVLNFHRLAAVADVTMHLVIAAAIAALVVLATMIRCVFRRAAALPDRPRPPKPRWLAPVAIIVASVALLLIAWIAINSVYDAIFTLCAGILTVLGVRRIRQRMSLPAAIAAIPRGHRIIGMISVVVVALAALLALFAHTAFDARGMIPASIADSLGSPATLSLLDERTKRFASDTEARYIFAVANHLAGNRERARELYASLGADPRARQNAEALNRGGALAVVPTGDELARAFTGSPFITTFNVLQKSVMMQASEPAVSIAPVMRFLLEISLALLIVMAIIFRSVAAAPVAPRPSGRLLHHRIAAGYVTIFLLAYGLVAIMAIRKVRAEGSFVPGFKSAESFTGPSSAFPLPRKISAQSLEVFLAFPHGRAIAASILLSLVAAVVLHAIALIRSRRTAAEDAPTIEADISSAHTIAR